VPAAHAGLERDQAGQDLGEQQEAVKSLLCALYGVVAIATACTSPAFSEHERRMIELEVRPESAEYIAGEDVAIRVRVANHGVTAIRIPDPEMRQSTQPVHSLSGPRWPDGIQFTNNRLLPRDERPADDANAQLITIGPGEAWSGVFSARPFVGAVEGDYRLASRLVFDGVKAESQPATFRIRSLRPGAVHLGLGTRPLETGEGEGAFIDAGALYTFTFQELRPGIGETVVMAPIRRIAVDQTATDVAVPWRNAPFFNELLRWVVWREGSQIKALSSTMTEPLSVVLPGEVSRLVRPPLKVTGQPVEVFALSADGRTLHLATIGGQPGETPRGAVAWSVPLAAPPGPITAALGPAGSDGERHLAYVVNRDAGFEVFHSRFKAGARPESFQNARVQAGSVIPTSTVAIFADASGAATVGVVSCSGADRRSCALIETTFGPEGKADAPKATSLGALAATPVDATVLYAEKNGTLDRRTVVVKLDNGSLLKLQGAGLVPVSSPGTPSSPILLAPGKQTTYILYVESRGLHLEGL
jgi:hypothetical protein